jgi:hypothetical protein
MKRTAVAHEDLVAMGLAWQPGVPPMWVGIGPDMLFRVETGLVAWYRQEDGAAGGRYVDRRAGHRRALEASLRSADARLLHDADDVEDAMMLPAVALYADGHYELVADGLALPVVLTLCPGEHPAWQGEPLAQVLERHYGVS